MTLLERFEQKFIPEPNTGCWLWTAAMDDKGYGTISYGVTSGGNTKPSRASRVSYELYKGKIPEGLHVLHRCDTPACVNPDHLFVGTHLDNYMDMLKKNRHGMKNKTHCPSGHEYTPPNTKIFQGRRYCRACKNADSRRRYQRNKLKKELPNERHC